MNTSLNFFCTRGRRDDSFGVSLTPLACEFKCIGQTGRCTNTRLTEHRSNVKNNASQSEVRHLMDCGNCYPVRDEYALLNVDMNDSTNLIKKALEINTTDNCASKTSVAVERKKNVYGFRGALILWGLPSSWSCCRHYEKLFCPFAIGHRNSCGLAVLRFIKMISIIAPFGTDRRCVIGG